MNLKKLSDKMLIEKVDLLVRQERELLTVVLHHLAEVNARRLFSSLGYKSLFEYASKRLGYSEDQAYRRIAAMKLLVELPEIEPKIESGDLNLTHLGMAQTHFGDASSEEKLKILEDLEGTSAREAKEIVAPQKAKEIKISVSPEVLEKLETLKGLLAHQNLNLNEVIDKLCDIGLKKLDPAQKLTRESSATSRVTSRYVAAKVRQQVWLKYKSQCAKCGSKHALQIDHCKPYGVGGETKSENLRLLCRNCNQRAALQTYGREKMQVYLT